MLKLTVVVAAGAQAVLAVHPPPPEWPVPGPWQIVSTADACVATQVLPDEVPQARIVFAASGPNRLIVVAKDIHVERKRPEDIDLKFDDRSFRNVHAVGYQDNAVQKGFAADVDDQMSGALASASALTVSRGGQVLMKLHLSGSKATLEQLQKCAGRVIVQKFEARSKIPTVPAPPVPRRQGPAPVMVVNKWVSEDDYPVRAIKAQAEGKVRAKVEVSPEGSPSNCTIVQSSGNAELDFRSCMLMEDRFRYLPALDAQGRAHPSEATSTFLWQLPPDEAPAPAQPTN